MAYIDNAALWNDGEFNQRSRVAVITEGQAKPGNALAEYALRIPDQALAMFLPFLTTAPGFGDKYASGGSASIADGEILAAVQANWDEVATLHADVIGGA